MLFSLKFPILFILFINFDDNCLLHIDFFICFFEPYFGLSTMNFFYRVLWNIAFSFLLSVLLTILIFPLFSWRFPLLNLGWRDSLNDSNFSVYFGFGFNCYFSFLANEILLFPWEKLRISDFDKLNNNCFCTSIADDWSKSYCP